MTRAALAVAAALVLAPQLLQAQQPTESPAPSLGGRPGDPPPSPPAASGSPGKGARGGTRGAEPPANQRGPDAGIGWRNDDVELRLRALIAADYRHYDRRNQRDRDPRLDRALLGVEGELLDDLLRFRVLADLRGTDTRGGLEEAWLTLDPTCARVIRLSAGLLKLPLGIEAGLPEETLPFLDHAFPDRLTSRHDLGVRLDGELLEGLLAWDVSFGFGEGFDGNGQRLDDPQLAARVQVYPFRWLDDVQQVVGLDVPLLSGVFLNAGVAHSWGWASSYEVANAFRNKLVVSPRLEADRREFFQLGGGIDMGPLRVIYEFNRGSLLGLDTAQGDQDLEGQFSAWALSATLRLGAPGYDSRALRQWEARRQGSHTSLAEGGPGLFELGVRYSNSEWDRDLFQPLGLIPITTGGRDPLGQGGSSQEFRTVEGSLVWSPVRTVRLGVYVIRVIADQFPGAFDSHGRDTSLAVRLQVDL